MLDPEQCVSRSSGSAGEVELLVDGIPLSSEPKGVGIYVYRILEQLAELRPGFRMTILLQRRARKVQELLPKGVNIELVPWRNHLWHGLHVIPRVAKKIRARAVLVPYETPIGPLRAPFGMVCHDVPQVLSEAQREGGKVRALSAAALRIVDNLLLASTLRKAAAVFANSEWVARELASRYRISPSRLRLAPCAPAVDFVELSRNVDMNRVHAELGAPEGYILVIYTGDHRENFSIVPAVYDRVVSQGLPHKLVVVGVRDNERRQVEDMVETYPWRRRVRIEPFVPVEKHQRLADLYTAASVYFDPSLQEGFGMQVVEAMACGTSIVCSDRGALSEVAGGVAILVDPADVSDMAEKLIALLDDKTSVQARRQRARERSRQFSWRISATRIRDALLDAAHPQWLRS